jgi:phospholipase C
VTDTPDRPDDLPVDAERRRVLGGLATLGAGVALGGCEITSGRAPRTAADLQLDETLRRHVRHIVVIFAENRSFANLYGDFPGVQYPLSAVKPEQAQQLDRDGKTPLPVLPKIWGGLVPQAQEVDGKRYVIAERDIDKLPNAPFRLADAQGKPLPNGVITRDLWHRFYQNQMQIAGGRNNQFAAWADSGGLVMGHYRNPPTRCACGTSRGSTRCATTSSWRHSADRGSTTCS